MATWCLHNSADRGVGIRVAAEINADGSTIATRNRVILALFLSRFPADGIQNTLGSVSRLEGCYIGVAQDGFTRRSNGATTANAVGTPKPSGRPAIKPCWHGNINALAMFRPL